MDLQLIYSQTFKITDTQTDCFRRLRPSALLELSQDVSTAHARLLGLGQDALDPKGLFWVIVRQAVDVSRMPMLGETVIVETWPAPPTRTAFPRYVVGRTPEGEILFRVAALWLFVDRESRTLVLPGASGLTVPGITREGALPLPTGIAPKTHSQHELRRVRFSELDANCHLSNTKYANWMEDLLPSAFHQSRRLQHLHISYVNEALEDEDVMLNWDLEGDCLSLEAVRNADNQRVFALKAQYTEG